MVTAITTKATNGGREGARKKCPLFLYFLLE
jgi:hypothetical protein